MRLGMRCGCSVQSIGGVALDAAIDLGHADQRPGDAGTALWRLAGVARKTAQERRLSPQRGDECLGLAFSLGKSDSGRCPLDQSPCKLILQREESQPSALVAGRQFQTGCDEVLEGRNVAG